MLVRRTSALLLATVIGGWSIPVLASPPDDDEIAIEDEANAAAGEGLAGAGAAVDAAGGDATGNDAARNDAALAARAAGEDPSDPAAAKGGNGPTVGTDAMTPEELEAVGLSPEGEILDPKAYAEWLRKLVASKRDAVLDKISEKAMDKQLARMDFISTMFSIISLLGIVVLLAPLWLRKRYPGKGGLLWKYSAIAALLFVLTINLFAGVLGVLRAGQMIAGDATNPQIQIVDATFTVIEDKAEDIAPMGPVIVEPTLLALTGDSEEAMPVLILQNVQKFKEDFKIFTAVANFFKGISWVFGYLPIVLSLVTVAVFMLGLRPTLTDIVKLPQRAAEGEAGVAGRVTKATLTRVGWEFVVTMLVMVVLMVVMITAGALLSIALEPAIEAFLAYLSVAFIYVQVVPDASSAAVLVGLGGTVLFLVLDLAVIIMAAALFIGKVHKIFQRRFHDKEPLAVHGRFWKWGIVSLVWALSFPLVYILGAKPAVEVLIDKTTNGDDINWALVLTSGPVVLVVCFIALFLALRGHKAIGFIAKYKVPKLGRPIGDALPVRSGFTGPQATVGATVVEHDPYAAADPYAPAFAPAAGHTAPNPRVEAEVEIDIADDYGHVPVRTGLTRGYATVGSTGPGRDGVVKKTRLPTTRYGRV